MLIKSRVWRAFVSTHTTSAAPSLNYFYLLRALFKSIGGGKFEQLYKEFLPLLPSLLHGLIRAHAAASPSAPNQPALRELLLELCLTLPARLSTLLDDDRIVGICDALLGEGFNYASGDGNFYSGETGW